MSGHGVASSWWMVHPVAVTMSPVVRLQFRGSSELELRLPGG